LPLTELQKKWLADALGIDVRRFPSVPGANAVGTASAARRVADARPSTQPPSQTPAPAASSGKRPAAALPARIGIAISNNSDQTLRLVTTKSDGGKFDPAPPNEIAPGAKTALAAVGTGLQGGSLIYQLEPKGGITDKPA
jgi:hypothetical protein